MKFLLPLPLLCLFCLSATAQAEFAPIGARWFQNAAIENIWDTHPLQDFYVIESEKDTLVGGLLHRKVGDYLFYQDGDKVYYRWQDSLRLVYDYGVAVGDTVRFDLLYGYEQEEGLVPIQNTYIVDTVSFVQAGSASLKKVDCSLLEGYECYDANFPDSVAFSYSYIERLGSVRGVLESLNTCGLTIPGAITEWLRCYEDEEVSYQTERFLLTAEEGEGCDYRAPTSTQEPGSEIEWLVFPNPVSEGPLQVQTDYAGRYTATLYNAYGQAVRTQEGQGDLRIAAGRLPAGLYRLVLRRRGDGGWLGARGVVVK
ncbi:MAG: hypothetical protein GVY26_08405 [Bacteroidetes bacterium]|nr:hypothetical protein [Bacteroidota bacterium]